MVRTAQNIQGVIMFWISIAAEQQFTIFLFFFSPCLEITVPSLLPMVENLLFIVATLSHKNVNIWSCKNKPHHP